MVRFYLGRPSSGANSPSPLCDLARLSLCISGLSCHLLLNIALCTGHLGYRCSLQEATFDLLRTRRDDREHVPSALVDVKRKLRGILSTPSPSFWPCHMPRPSILLRISFQLLCLVKFCRQFYGAPGRTKFLPWPLIVHIRDPEGLVFLENPLRAVGMEIILGNRKIPKYLIWFIMSREIGFYDAAE
ncbi:hypothetical protein PoB_005872500 [Plakobranchus ocellatus]|uniref:Uncharacterized protein n=1 Tax=Plakobranchus ocellatus TaxID=259542 RepID=A0AAV4CKQ2_9GAST|nr:hypothetical protein PoB_005872500 [Plakobranchus ocellatus]